MDPAFFTAFAKLLESAVNRALIYDPGSRAALDKLAGKILGVQFTRPAIDLFCVFEQGRVRLNFYGDEPADCTLTGSLPAVLGLLRREHPSLAGTGVTVVGDLVLLQKLQRVLAALELDWEQAVNEAAAGVVGAANADLLVHPVAHFLRGRGQWVRRQAETAPDWLHDFITEELRLLPSPHEVAAFARDIDELRSATERLEARLRQLRQALDSKPTSRV